MKKLNNPAAFPLIDNNYIQEGMTLRDYFASKAMQSVMIGIEYNHVKSSEAVAEWAFAVVDAMLKQREL